MEKLRKSVLRNMLVRYAQYLWDYGYADAWKAIFSLLETDSKATLLDLGCGEGEATMKVAQKVGVKFIIGIDVNEESLIRTKQMGIMTYKSDLNDRFPLEDESVDIVFANQVIEHLINVDNFIKEILRVLKPNGYLILCTENLASWHNIVALVMGNQPYSGPEVSTKFIIGHHPLNPYCKIPENLRGTMKAALTKHNTVLSYKAIKILLELYGFSIEKIVGSGYYPFPKTIGRILSRLNPSHTHFITIKARKL